VAAVSTGAFSAAPPDPIALGTVSLASQTTLAAQWRFTGAVAGAASQLVVGVILAHLLTPSDFGVLALAFFIIGLARPLGDLGVGNAVVQRTVLTERHVRTAFTFSTLMGLAVAAGIVVVAPLGAAALRNPQVTPILRGLGVSYAFGGTAAVAGALLRRRMDFKRQALIDTGTYVIGYGGVSISMALLGYGVWSLVWGNLVQSLLSSVLVLLASRHSLQPLLARCELGELLHFGLGASASGVVNYVALNVDNFVVGRWLGAASLGLYSRAYNLMNLPSAYSAVVMSSVLFPAFAQVQAEPARLRRGYLLITQLTAMIAAPAMVTLAIAAPHLLRSVYGPQWIGAAVPLQILGAAGYFRALYHLGGIVAQSSGRVYRELWCQFVYAALVIAGALVGVRYGLPGVAVGVSLAILFMFVALGQLALTAIDTPWRSYLRSQIAAFLTATIVCVLALAARLVLEASGSSSAAITIAILATASIPWAAGMLWQLGEPEFEPVRAQLPAPCAVLVHAFRQRFWRAGG
jgi:PST family polysaccharide transporter